MPLTIKENIAIGWLAINRQIDVLSEEIGILREGMDVLSKEVKGRRS